MAVPGLASFLAFLSRPQTPVALGGGGGQPGEGLMDTALRCPAPSPGRLRPHLTPSPPGER